MTSNRTKGYHLYVRGIVQGVGFRPAVYRIAQQWGMDGYVRNDIDGLHVYFNAVAERAEAFVHALLEGKPPMARIDAWELVEMDPVEEQGFHIVASDQQGQGRITVTPDFGMCAHCAEELLDPSNRRYGYAFTTCTDCGPRYSIIQALPYDRARTTMAPFKMCAHCAQEYSDPMDRRYHSQTNSCPDCAIHMRWHASNGRVKAIPQEEIPKQVAHALERGAIVAVKGIGGYLLLADATDERVVQRLRERKQRPDKPLAVMYPDLASVRKDFTLGEEEASALTSPVSPIVLLSGKPSTLAEGIAPGLQSIGVMLPYTPLYLLIMKSLGRPIVATSGNISGSPILYRDEDALRGLAGVADVWVSNDREIVVPQDDSVMRISTRGIPIWLRRSRGLAPSVPSDFEYDEGQEVLAMGGHLKASITLAGKRGLFTSQYLGELSTLEAQRYYDHTLAHLMELTEIHPELVLVDKHPDYYATQRGEAFAAEHELSVYRVQHHKAHFAAVLSEHGLWDSAEPVLGVILDGTGYGDDGQIWGGEWMVYHRGEIQRVGHVPYFTHLSGDKMARQPRLSALAVFGAVEELRGKFSDREWSWYTRAVGRGQVRSSSMGRVFDAVASLLGLCDVMSYEGQAAMMLETIATRWVDQCGGIDKALRTIGHRKNSFPSLCREVLEDCRRGVDRGRIAFSFHLGIASWIRAIAEELDIRKVAFSGGVWQNALLVDLVSALMEDRALYFHRHFPPNDECISFGQVMYYRHCVASEESSKTIAYVFGNTR